MAASGSSDGLQHRHIFGLKGDVKGNVAFVDETTLVYPVGHNVILFNSETRTQQFIQGESTHFASEGITALAVSSTATKRVVAVAERTERGALTIYDLASLRRRRLLTMPDLGSREYVSVAFSSDGKLCLAQGGEPEWTLVLFGWEKGKIIASAKVANVQGATIHQADFCPTDNSVVCVTGNGLLRFLRASDGQLRPIPMTLKRDPQNYLCHCWLSDQDRVMVATDTGELMLFENFEFRQVLQSSPADGKPITSIVSYSKGFVCGGSEGVVRIFERSDDSREYYKATKVFTVEGNLVDVTNLAVSPNEDTLVCSLANDQVFVLSLSNIDILKEDAMNFELLSTGFHGPGQNGLAQVTGLDTCVRKPLVLSCGMDRTVRVWNYLEMTTDLMKSFEEEPYSCAFHPSGLHILVGFTDKLRLMNLLMDDIRTVKEFPIKVCREVRFSNGGQYFAAANNNTVQIYSTYTCEMITTLRGHNSKVRSIWWKPDDKRLVTAGMDGSVFLWDSRQTKQGEFMQPRCHFYSAAGTSDCASVYAAGSDQTIKDIDVVSGVVRHEEPSACPLGALVLSSSQRLLFAGTVEQDRPGVIRCYKLPLPNAEMIEYQTHAAPVTRMALSYDNQHLFTAGEDGSLAVFDVRERDARGGPGARSRDRDAGGMAFAEEILVTKSDLEEKQSMMSELKAKVDELTLHNEYQLRLKDMNYKEKIKEVTEKFTSELEQDRARYEELRDEKRDMELEYEEKLRELEEKHVHEVQDLEQQYKGKINAEVARYQQLVQERDEQNARWDEENRVLVESHTQYIAELTDDYDRKIDEEKEQQRELQEQKESKVSDFNEEKDLVEEDADMEIEELKERYDLKLHAEREATLRLKGENGIMKKKFSALQKDIDDQREEIRSAHDKEKELYENIKGLEKDIQGHKKEIREREETIQDKDKRIYDLRKKNQELEKFKFVLDYKIKELRRQIAPRESEIADMRQQIEEMDQELEQYHKSNAALDLMIGELRLKMDGMQKELSEQRENLKDGNSLIARFRTDLHDTAQHLADHRRLKEGVVRLYKTFVQNQFESDNNSDADVQREYNRQREYLEKSVESLKRKLAKDVEMHRNDHMRLMRENVALTKEINELRREVKLVRQEQQRAELEEQLGIMEPEAGAFGADNPQMPPGSSQRAHRSVEDDAAWREVEMQQEQIAQLQGHISKLQEAVNNGGQLPESRGGFPSSSSGGM